MLKILYILAAICILGVIVVVHEFGHYLVGRLCGIGVVEFAVGMGPKLFGWKRKGIQYSVRLIPLGGFCKFVGEDEAHPAPNAMNNAKVWKRFLTVAAGPVMNFVFAYVVAVVLLANYMTASLLPKIDAVVENTPAYAAGFQAGDVVTAVNGQPISYDNDGALKMREQVQAADETTALNFTLNRNGETVETQVTPALVDVESVDENGNTTVTQALQIGIQFSSRTCTFAEAVPEAGRFMLDVTKMMLTTLKNLVFKGEGVKEVSGPVGIISFVSGQVKEGWYMILYIVFLISLNLGIMNLLPLPALDGGRLVFLIVEGIRRKPVPPEKEGMVHAIGFLLLLVLIGLVTYQDIARLITGG